MDIYRENILDHYKNPRNFGRLDKPDVSYEAGNPLCGDVIGMEIKKRQMADGRWQMVDIKFWGEGCAISQASASMLTEKVKGMALEDIKILRYEDIKKMLGIELSPVRMKCALLPLEVLQKAIALV
ncbi:iron-sulfur cluster assembly scaffold protein [Candidatus Gottesmanbacteria bacterium]|nr:iron-sulfur cluster assembly scaffold protein [Candidatus Gottesmanbacteria bacterium]